MESMDTLEGYEIIKQLDAGGMGEVLLARQRAAQGIDRLVVIKTLLPETAHSPSAASQFGHEVRISSALNHPGIVTVIESGLWGQRPFVVMEYIHGASLARLCSALAARGERLAVEHVALIARDVALALDYAHRAHTPTGQPLNIVHRDISPQNIMLRSDGGVKVVDFGIARDPLRPDFTRAGVVRGRIRYMAPELLWPGGEATPSSDQFALGVVLWELSAGRRLFAGLSDEEVIAQLRGGSFVPSQHSAGPLPVLLHHIVDRMLSHDPASRYERCQDVAEALDAFLDQSAGLPLRRSLADTVHRVLGEDLASQVARSGEGTHDGRDLTLTPTAPDPSPEQSPQDRAAGWPDSDAGSLPRRQGSSAAAALPTAAATAPTVRSRAPGGRLLLLAAASLGALMGGLWWATDGLRQQQPTTSNDATDIEAAVRRDAGAANPGQGTGRIEQGAASLLIKSNPSRARLKLDGRYVGKSPLRLPQLAPAAPHELVVDKRGYVSARLSVSLSPGEHRELTVELTPTPRANAAADNTGQAPPDQQPGFLTVQTSPWTTVRIDGEPWGASPVYRVRLSPGLHTLQLTNEAAGVDVTRTVKIIAGQTSKLNLELTPKGP